MDAGEFVDACEALKPLIWVLALVLISLFALWLLNTETVRKLMNNSPETPTAA